MKVKNRERLIKAIGKLDGIAYCATGGVGDAICDVIEGLEGILEDEERMKGQENGKREVQEAVQDAGCEVC